MRIDIPKVSDNVRFTVCVDDTFRYGTRVIVEAHACVPGSNQRCGATITLDSLGGHHVNVAIDHMLQNLAREIGRKVVFG